MPEAPVPATPLTPGTCTAATIRCVRSLTNPPRPAEGGGLFVPAADPVTATMWVAESTVSSPVVRYASGPLTWASVISGTVFALDAALAAAGRLPADTTTN